MKKTYNFKADILTLEQVEDVYSWKRQKSAWVSTERENRLNIFSRVGIGAVSVIFYMHPTAITLHEMLFVKGQHYFITSIEETSPTELKVKTATVTPLTCTSETDILAVEDDNLEPKQVSAKTISFPAILTEKYLKDSQKEPMVELEKTFVLITPKAILLHEADIVKAGDKSFIVHLCHTLDEFKNEYEISVREDN